MLGYGTNLPTYSIELPTLHLWHIHLFYCWLLGRNTHKRYSRKDEKGKIDEGKSFKA